MRRSLRVKLVLAYAGLSILAVSSLSLYVNSRLSELLLDQLKGTIHAQAGLVAEAVATSVGTGDLAAVQDYLRRADSEVDARLLVVGRSPGLLATDSEENLSNWEAAVQRPGILAAFQGQTSEQLASSSGSGDELIYVATPIYYRGAVVGAVRLSYQLRDVEGAFRRVQFVIFTGALATAAATAALGWLFASRISGPLRALSRAAHRLAEGDLSQQVTVRSDDEVGELVESFNTMAARLREHDIARREFASDVSHELHALASAMQTAAEALERGARNDPTLLDRLVAGLVQHTRRLGRLADDLLELARLEGGRMGLELEDCDLAEVARLSVIEFAAEAERRELQLVLDAPESIPARVDPTRLSQALGNLIENALKYSPRGTAITVRARRDRLAGVALDVVDEGPGIPPQVLARVFERYYRVEGRASGGPGGMGLGLNIVARIARAHGGSVEARSAPAGGTIFTIHLPDGSGSGQDAIAPHSGPERTAALSEATSRAGGTGTGGAR